MNRHDRRDFRPSPAKPSFGTGLRIVAILGVACLAAMIASRIDVRPDRVVTPPGPVKIARLNPRDLQAASESNGFDGGAKAGQAALALSGSAKPSAVPGGTVHIAADTTDPSATATKADPRHPQAAIRIVGIRSDKAYTNRDDALRDARLAARHRLAEVLGTLDPPIHVLPSEERIAADYIAPESARDVPPSPEVKELWKASQLDENRRWASVDLEVSESQLRTLRAKQRLLDSGWVLGIAFAALGAAYGVLKLDALAKHHFTKAAAPAVV